MIVEWENENQTRSPGGKKYHDFLKMAGGSARGAISGSTDSTACRMWMCDSLKDFSYDVDQVCCRPLSDIFSR